jgi:hypothetical protein
VLSEEDGTNYNHVSDNESKNECANSQDGDFDFIRDGNCMQTAIADATASVDKELLQ